MTEGSDTASELAHSTAQPTEYAGAIEPVAFMFHGYGSNRADLLGLGVELDPRLTVVSVDAPLSLDAMGAFGGRAWFHLGQRPDGSITYDTRGAIQAVESLEAFIAAWLARNESDSRRVMVGGFSQGAMMAHALLIRGRVPVHAVMGLSGRDVNTDIATDENPDRVPVFVSHGVHDQVIPIDRGRAIRAFYENTDVELTYSEYAMGHEVNAQCLADARAWTASVIDTWTPR